jgi:MFS family permease
LSGSVAELVVARVVQGLGAALLTPQTLLTITRIFPAERRGVAMSVWGAAVGVATLAGPIAGGVLVDQLGWQWIFFVNVPIGIVGLGLAVWLIPVLPTHPQDEVSCGVAATVSLQGVDEFVDGCWARPPRTARTRHAWLRGNRVGRLTAGVHPPRLPSLTHPEPSGDQWTPHAPALSTGSGYLPRCFGWPVSVRRH